MEKQKLIESVKKLESLVYEVYISVDEANALRVVLEHIKNELKMEDDLK